jgi:hypothetical protein
MWGNGWRYLAGCEHRRLSEFENLRKPAAARQGDFTMSRHFPGQPQAPALRLSAFRRGAGAGERDYDVDKLFAYLRKRTAEFQAAGWKVVDLAGERREADATERDQSCVVREEPPKP